METAKRNSYGLFDAPVRQAHQASIELTPEDIERQLDAGAFMITHEEALIAGFLNPHDTTDTVIVTVREAV